jgi:hypothetical protein
MTLRLPGFPEAATATERCTCRKPVTWYHLDGQAECARCRRPIDPAREDVRRAVQERPA